MDEASKHGKTFQAFGAEITLKEGSLTPNYEEDEVYADLKSQMKAREELLKIAFRQAGKTAIFDESTGEQVRALVAAARSVPTVELPPQKIDLTGEFVDWSDPKKTVYRRDPATGVLYGPDGRAITSQRAMAALGVVEAGDTPENRAALAKIQAPPAPKQPTGGTGQPGAGTGQVAATTTSPEDQKKAEIDQLRGMLKAQKIPRGTPQYDAALRRLDELEGVE